ncbi:hypothetical protein AGMMS50229_11770 [Campylobacterota bacterium]|nr:hypothetical protein AGMMS50229_11770 [Campylobacterota bacterium]
MMGCLKLGAMYQNGTGVKQDWDKANEYYNKLLIGIGLGGSK